MSINQRIKQVRKSLRLSQAKFAKNLCLSSGYFAGIELENRRVNDRIVKLICVTYGVNEGWLKTGDGEMYSVYYDARTEQTLKVFRELKSEYQDYILKLVENLLGVQEAEKENGARLKVEKEYIEEQKAVPGRLVGETVL